MSMKWKHWWCASFGIHWKLLSWREKRGWLHGTWLVRPSIPPMLSWIPKHMSSLLACLISRLLHFSSWALWFTWFERSTTGFQAIPVLPCHPSLVNWKHEGEESVTFQREHAKCYFSFPSSRLSMPLELRRSWRFLAHKQASAVWLGT